MTGAQRVWGAAPLAALGGAGFAAVFTPHALVVPLVVAALVGTAARVLVTGPGGRDAPRRAGAGVVLVLLGAAVALRSTPLVLVDGVRQGPRDILGAALPAPAEACSLAVPYLLTVAAAYAGAALAQSAACARGGLRPLVPMLPSLTLMLAGLSFGGAGGLTRATWVPLAWAGLALVVLATGTTSAAPTAPRQAARPVAGTGERARRPRALAGALMAGVAVLVAVPVSRHAPARDDGARLLVPRAGSPAEQPGQSNPLGRVTGFQDGADDLLFVAETSAPVARWRVAVLDRYDGTRWSSERVYRPAGRQLPARPGPPATESWSVEQVEQTVELVPPAGGDVTGDLPWGRWLPVADRAVELSADGVLFEAVGGTAVVAADRPVPDTYDVVSRIGEPAAGRLVDARAAGGEEATAALRLPPDVPDELRTMARQVAAGADSDYAIAAAIEERLMGDGFQLVTADPPGGHTFGHLAGFVGDAGSGGESVEPSAGSVEQFVATFAVVARLAGLPSRIVVGFHGAGVAGRQEISAHEATAWVEVKFERVGWVVFDPVPAAAGYVPARDEPVAGPDDSAGPAAALAESGTEAAADRPDGAGSVVTDGFRAATRVVRRGSVIALAVLMVGGLAAPGTVRRWRRHRRRRAPSAAGGVVGSWLTVVDELKIAGVDASAASAVSDLVGEGRRRFGARADPLVALGGLANRCRFAGVPVTDEHARHAWELCDAFVAARRRGRPVDQRLREYLGLRGKNPNESRSSPPGVT